MTFGPFTHISPTSLGRRSAPSSPTIFTWRFFRGGPMLPARHFSGRFTETIAVDSVKPYPSVKGTGNVLLNACNTSPGKSSPPDVQSRRVLRSFLTDSRVRRSTRYIEGMANMDVILNFPIISTHFGPANP